VKGRAGGLASLLLLAFAAPAPASAPAPAPAPAQELIIRGARLYTLIDEGIIDRGDILIRDGRIAAVGRDLVVPRNAKVIDASGKQITPGLMSSCTNLGVVDITAIDDTVDSSTTDADIGASFAVAPALNPLSAAIAYNRTHGLTYAIVMPESASGIFAGQAAAIRLGERDSFLLADSVAMFATLGKVGARLSGGSRASALIRMERALLDALEMERHRKAVLSGSWRELSVPLADLEALVPVAHGRKALIVAADRYSDIVALLRLKRRLGLRLILAGGSEAWMLADELAASGVAVLLDPMANVSRDFDRLNARADNALRLHEANVLTAFCAVDFTSFGSSSAKYRTHIAHLVRLAAGNAAAQGMPAVEAIRAMTANPTRLFGLADRFGTLEPGKEADLVIWDGDPLELLTRAEQVLIHGTPVSMSSRATLLRERYRTANPTEMN
jgi:imidazolonepropionase-like amidohydrolase